MVDLGLNQYKIEEIKYRVKENKIVTFKLHNFNIEDVTVEEVDAPKEAIEEPDYHPFSSIEDYKKPVGEMDVKELGKSIINYLKEEIPPQGEHPYSRKKKELHDYKPVSCLEGENGMQKTLEASRKKEWFNDVLEHPSKPTETGNALIPKDNSVVKDLLKNKNTSTISNLAKECEIKEFKINDQSGDNRMYECYRNKTDKKLSTDLVRAKRIIDDYVTTTSKAEKERFAERVKDKYFKLDPNDDFSKIKSLNDLNDKLIENSK